MLPCGYANQAGCFLLRALLERLLKAYNLERFAFSRGRFWLVGAGNQRTIRDGLGHKSVSYAVE